MAVSSYSTIVYCGGVTSIDVSSINGATTSAGSGSTADEDDEFAANSDEKRRYREMLPEMNKNIMRVVMIQKGP